jgi:hypothetical protein
MASAVEELQSRFPCADITRATTVLIDDDRQNIEVGLCVTHPHIPTTYTPTHQPNTEKKPKKQTKNQQVALKAGVRAFWLDPRRPDDVIEHLLQISSPPSSSSSSSAAAAPAASSAAGASALAR